MSKLFILDVYNFINAQRFEDGCVPEEKINTEELLEDIKSVIITQESIISSRDKCIDRIRQNHATMIDAQKQTKYYILKMKYDKLKEELEELEKFIKIKKKLAKQMNVISNNWELAMKKNKELKQEHTQYRMDIAKLKQQNETFKNTIINVLKVPNDVVCCDCGQHESHKKIKWTYCTDDTDKQLSSVSPVWCCEQCLDKGCEIE
tara:strand:- start:847 stop:1461 length:615 start_codon:yes stop_codon:yes gene_type:complete